MLPPAFLLVSALLGLFLCLGSRWETVGVVYVGMCRWNICVIIHVDTLWLNCLTCLWMYCKNASLDQQPIIMILQTEQSLKKTAMATPDPIKCVPISDFLMCKRSLPMATIASFMNAITCADVTWSIQLKLQKAEMGVLLWVLCRI